MTAARPAGSGDPAAGDRPLPRKAGRGSKRVLLCTPYAAGVTQGPYFSFEQYLDDPLGREGYVIVRSPFVPGSFSSRVRAPGKTLWKLLALVLGYGRRVLDLLRSPLYDGVYVSDWFVPFGPAWLNDAPSRLFPRSVLDVCDRIYEPHRSDLGAFVSRLRRPGNVKRLAKRVTEIVVVTRFMKEELAQLGRPITVISSSLDTGRYAPRPESRRGRPVVGWTGSRSTSRYLMALGAALAAARRRADFELVVIGDPDFRFPDLPVTVLPWTPETEVASLQRLDVGLYPLENDAWALGKAGMKAIQYMAVGVPVVASPVAVTPDLVVDGVTGFLAEDDGAWTDAIVRLVSDDALRTRMGASGRDLVESRYSTAAVAPLYSALFSRAFGPARRD